MGANLMAASLIGGDLRIADCRGGDFSGADLSNANLRETDFRHADSLKIELPDYVTIEERFLYTDLTGADLSHTDLTGTKFSEPFMQLKDVRSLRNCVGLEKELELKLKREKPGLFE